ncbi:DNA-3-methyladenine glycosylase I [Kitasatospora sp. NPDC058444]|uniref:DNA-3-methyladenine glycosylase I n=1 Tax=Kitasatospora sp. NPDC058444 TaxID=3346504 RepID=UPI003666D232
MSTSPTSIALSKDLRKLGRKFVGPTTAFAFMQAMGAGQRPCGGPRDPFEGRARTPGLHAPQSLTVQYPGGCCSRHTASRNTTPSEQVVSAGMVRGDCMRSRRVLRGSVGMKVVAGGSDDHQVRSLGGRE